MKIIQLNAWIGRLNGPLAEFIREQQPDILCLQEVVKPKSTEPKLFYDQYRFLAETKEAGSFDYEFFSAAYAFSLAGVMFEDGNAVLSKFPITNKRAAHTHQHYYVCDNPESHLPNDRLIQTCEVELPNGKPLSIANYQGHLENPKGMGNDITIKTMEKARDEVARLPRPLIFCGDFNVWPTSPALAVLDDLKLHNLVVENKITTTLSPVHRAPEEERKQVVCDYILISPEIKVKNFSVSEQVVSDHKALILEFEI